MADVFLSYKRDERPAIETIANELRHLGLSVWFDASLSAGEAFSDEIDRELQSAKAVLVCWSPAAIQSKWVKVEALTAFENDKLVACQVAGDGAAKLPVPFNAVHAENLSDWLKMPTATDIAWRNVLRRVGQLCDGADIEAWGTLKPRATIADLQSWMSTHGASPLLISADAELRAAELEEATKAVAEREAQRRRTQNEAIQVSLKRREERERLEAESAEKARQDKKTRWKQSRANLIIGSILAIPVFFVVYVVVAIVGYLGVMLLQWLNMDRFGSGITRMSELVAAGASGYWGIQVGRHAVDRVATAWSGWPTFLLLLAGWGWAISSIIARIDVSTQWWLLVVTGLHVLFAVVLGYYWVALKRPPD